MKKKNIAWILLSILILVLATNFLIPVLTGSTQLLIVLSGSMNPVMQPGDMIAVESVSPDELEVGDVIAYQEPGGDPNVYITHRIISIEEGEERIFQTKGDANEEKDTYQVPASDIVGEMVFVIPFAGYLPEASNNSMIFFFTVILPASLIVLDEIKNMIMYSDSIKARKMEKQKRKRSRDYPYIIKGKRLLGIALVSLIILTLVILPYSGDNGYVTMDKEGHSFENEEFLPGVLVFTPEDVHQRLSINPWYTMLSTGEETTVTADENLDAAVTSVPYILPVFWIISLAEYNPYLPSAAMVIIYTTLGILTLFPFWCQKAKRKNHKKKTLSRNFLSRRFRIFH